jgi:uncharacterized protein YecE (DUF72 family)
MAGTVRIGISGWTYRPWRGKFYPKNLPQKCELAYASSKFRTVEINGTFYGQQRPESYAHWAAETPDDFVFSIKGPRYITHMRRLIDIKAPLANFLASGLLRLGPKLGPILWQFPTRFRFDPGRFDAFFQLLPHDTEAAVALARHYDVKLRSKAWLETDAGRPMRHAVEIRHESFATPEFIKLLRRHKMALVCADTVDWPMLMDVTADFVYCRLHGSEELYVSGYDEQSLRVWAARVKAWARGEEPKDAVRVVDRPAPKQRERDVYVYFDNDAKVRAPVDALRLDELVDGPEETTEARRPAASGTKDPRAAF